MPTFLDFKISRERVVRQVTVNETVEAENKYANDVIRKRVVALHNVQEMPENGVEQLDRRSDARPRFVCLIAAVIDGVGDLGFCVVR
jgi:hypothetical protein